MSAEVVLGFACGALAGWLARRAYVRWRSVRAARAVLHGFAPTIIKRAP
jgi:hypothetical protein